MKDTLTMLVKCNISVSTCSGSFIIRTAPVLLGALSGRKFGLLILRMRTNSPGTKISVLELNMSITSIEHFQSKES